MMKTLAKSLVPKSTWAKLSGIRGRAERAITSLGSHASLEFLICSFLNRLVVLLPGHPKWIRRLSIKGCAHPIYYRIGTSDLDVIRQVFVRREYECVANERDVSLIIDCGANIGCTSFFLLHHYPQARVIAVEPDPDNFAMCQRNLKRFGDRAVVVNSGVWPTVTPLRVVRGSYRDGQDWSVQVRPACEGERPDLMGTTVLDLIDSSERKIVDLLKIDIESAEIQLFSKDAEKWLPLTRCLVIELHDDECERIFFQSLSEYHAEFEKSGELTICRKIGRCVGTTTEVAVT